METGTVLWFNNETGQGCIAPDIGDELLIATFDSFNDVKYKVPTGGQRVSFRTVHGPRGLHAVAMAFMGKSSDC